MHHDAKRSARAHAVEASTYQVSTVPSGRMAREHRCNRQGEAQQQEQPAADTLRLVEVSDQVRGERCGQDPVDETAKRDAVVLDLERV